ncbi:hypothetical protein [Amycolatopsis japonica]
MNVKFDMLLDWISERQRGGFELLKQTLGWLGGNAGPPENWTSAMTSLQALGHIEIDWRRRRWEVAPSAITTLPTAGKHALLTGARPRWLVRRLSNLCNDSELGAFQGCLEILPPVKRKDAPALHLIRFHREEDIEKIANILRINFAPMAGDVLLSVLPRLSSIMRLSPCADLPGGPLPRPMGVSLDKVDPFVEVADLRREERNSFRCDFYRQQRFFFRYDDTRVFESGRAEIIYFELARRRNDILSWNAENRELVVPYACRLPALYERATVLRSGLLPSRNTDAKTWTYHNIDAKFARSLARRLYQNLIVV